MSVYRGVNFGEWLTLEKWMEPSVFEGTQSRDEDNLCRVLREEDKIYTQIKIDEITNLGAVKIRLRSLFAAMEMKE